MGLLKDWMARWGVRLLERPAAEPGSVFITMDEKNMPVDVRTGDVTPKAYEDYIGKTVNLINGLTCPAERF